MILGPRQLMRALKTQCTQHHYQYGIYRQLSGVAAKARIAAGHCCLAVRAGGSIIGTYYVDHHSTPSNGHYSTFSRISSSNYSRNSVCGCSHLVSRSPGWRRQKRRRTGSGVRGEKRDKGPLQEAISIHPRLHSVCFLLLFFLPSLLHRKNAIQTSKLVASQENASQE